MACCSNPLHPTHSTQSALLRAFFSCGQARLLAMLLAVSLHAALLLSLPTNTPLRIHPWQQFSARAERHPLVQIVGLSSLTAANAVQAFVPKKTKQKEPAAERSLPKLIAESPLVTPRNELAAAPAQSVADSSGPVVGLALPQAGLMQGPRHLWSYQQGTIAPNAQQLQQAQMQRQAQLAMQADRQVARAKLEAQMINALENAELRSPCQLTVPPTGEMRLRCENPEDANAIQSVLDRSANTPAVWSDTTLVIDVMPRQSGGSQAVSHRADAER